MTSNLRCVASAPGLTQLLSAPAPTPQRGEVLVRVEAAGVSYTDVQFVNSTSRRSVPYPFVPGHDWVGRLVAFGEGAEAASGGLHVGDRVAALTQVGGMQQFICCGVHDVVRVPDGCDPAEAVSAVLNYTLAYGLLHRGAAGRVRAGGSVLVHSAAGGVGTALVHLAQVRALPRACRALPPSAAARGLPCSSRASRTSTGRAARARWRTWRGRGPSL